MLNKCTLQGRLTKNPELKKTTGGKSVCTFTIACERDIKDENGKREVDFIEIVAWNKTAEFVCNYMLKGYMAIVEGRLQFRTYTDRNGNSRRATEIQAQNVYSGESKKPVVHEDKIGGLYTEEEPYAEPYDEYMPY